MGPGHRCTVFLTLLSRFYSELFSMLSQETVTTVTVSYTNSSFFLNQFSFPRGGSHYWILWIYSDWKLNPWGLTLTAGGCKTHLLYDWSQLMDARGTFTLQLLNVWVLYWREGKNGWHCACVCGHGNILFSCVHVCVYGREKLINIAFLGTSNV